MYFYSLFLSRLFCVSSVVCVFFPSTFIVVNTKQGDVLHQQAVPIVCICVREQLPLRSPILWRLTGISQATEELFIAPVKIERSWLSVTVPEQMKSFQWTVDTSTGFLRFLFGTTDAFFWLILLSSSSILSLDSLRQKRETRDRWAIPEPSTRISPHRSKPELDKRHTRANTRIQDLTDWACHCSGRRTAWVLLTYWQGKPKWKHMLCKCRE